jgi:hypothetical protein
MIWTKSRNNSYRWGFYHKDIGVGAASGSNGTGLRFDTNAGLNAGGDSPLYQHPTATHFQPMGTQNQNHTYLAYLFATVAGVSKVGSFSESGSDVNVDCGFSNGARFVLIKRYDDSGNWHVFDTARGIVSGNDPAMFLDTTDSEQSSDYIDPLSSGFTVNASAWANGTYIFYAVA